MTSTAPIVFEKIKRLRTRAGLSERALARAAGFGESALAQCRKRKGVPSPELAKQVADYFGVDALDILDDARALPMAPIPRQHERDSGISEPVEGASLARDKIAKALARVKTLERELAALRTEIEDLLIP